MARNRYAPGSLFARWRPVASACYPRFVLSLVTLLISLLCCETSPPQYLAEAAVLRDAGDRDGGAESLETWLKSDAVLRAVLINTQWPELSPEPAAVGHARRVIELRERINILTLNQPDESPRIAITCTTTRSAAALALAKELAKQVAEHFEPQRRELARRQIDERLEQTRQRLRVVLESEERQRGELERLRHGQLAMAMTGPGRAAPGLAGELLNPRWVELKKQLDALHAERSNLLDVLQEGHPEISGINLRIAKLAASLERTPRQLASPVEPISHHDSAPRKPLLEWRREPSSIAQQQFQQEENAALPNTRQGLDPVLNMAAHIDEAAHQLAVLTSQRKGIEWDQGSLEQTLAELDEAPKLAWHSQPPRVAPRLSGGYSGPQLWMGTLFSVGIGGLVMLSQRLRRGRQLNSLADVLINVQLPLVAALEISPALDNSSSPAAPVTLLQLLTRCGEALILGTLLTCLTAAWFDPTLAAEFRLDPLGAFAETARRLL